VDAYCFDPIKEPHTVVANNTPNQNNPQHDADVEDISTFIKASPATLLQNDVSLAIPMKYPPCSTIMPTSPVGEPFCDMGVCPSPVILV
jgi:hypothetical protein